MRYRCDTSRPNPDGSTSHYAEWFGGPTLAKISDCLCEDGNRRTVEITGGPDSFFSVPAAVRVKGKRIKGFITTLDFAPHHNATVFVSTDRPGICPEYRQMINAMFEAAEDRKYPQLRRDRLAFQGYPYPSNWYDYQE